MTRDGEISVYYEYSLSFQIQSKANFFSWFRFFVISLTDTFSIYSFTNFLNVCGYKNQFYSNKIIYRVIHKGFTFNDDYIESLSSLVLTNSLDCKNSQTIFLFPIIFINFYKDRTKSKDQHTYKFAWFEEF